MFYHFQDGFFHDLRFCLCGLSGTGESPCAFVLYFEVSRLTGIAQAWAVPGYGQGNYNSYGSGSGNSQWNNWQTQASAQGQVEVSTVTQTMTETTTCTETTTMKEVMTQTMTVGCQSIFHSDLDA